MLKDIESNYYKGIIDDQISVLTIYWSADCNSACDYCFIKKDKPCLVKANAEICQSLKDGSFLKKIKTNLKHIKNQIDYVDFWGAEPTLNAPYFADFTIGLLEYFPKIKEIMFSTNAKVGGKIIYDYFVNPIREYCNQHNRKLAFCIQVSMDGPTEMNDEHRYPGATDKILNTIYYLAENYPKEKQPMFLNIFTKATVSSEYFERMLDLNYMQNYFEFLDNVYVKGEQARDGNPNIHISIGVPTFVNPGNNTVQDGKNLAIWLNNLCKVNCENFKYFNTHALFMQPYFGLGGVLNTPNILADGRKFLTCTTGKNNVVIDCKGNYYNCHIFGSMTFLDHSKIAEDFASTITTNNSKDYISKRLSASQFHDSLVSRKHFFDILVHALAAKGQISDRYYKNPKLNYLMFLFISSLWCPASCLLDYTHNYYVMPTSYIKLFGNGAVEALVSYYQHEVKRGVMSKWMKKF